MPPRRNAARVEAPATQSLNRDALSKALARVAPAVSRGGLVQAMTHYWFTPDEVRGYDGGLGIRLRYQTGLNCGVSQALSKLLATSPLSEVELVYEAENHQVRLKMGRSVSKLSALDSDARVWPYPEEPSASVKALPVEGALLEALRQVMFVRVGAPTRVEHFGVTIVPTKRELFLFTTDSISMARARVPMKDTSALETTALLPRALVEQLVGAGVDSAKLYAQPECLIVLSEDIDLYSNVLDLSSSDDLADVFNRITRDLPDAVEIPAGFAAALERAEILAGQADPYVSLAFEGEKLTVSGSYPFGSLNEELELSAAHPTVTLKVEAPRVRRGLAHSTELSASERLLQLGDGDTFAYIVTSVS